MIFTILLIVFGGMFFIRLFLDKFYGTIDPRNEINAKGKIVIITGANRGVGLATALEFAKRESIVILACRDKTRTHEAIKYIQNKTNRGQLVFMQLDLMNLESVRKFANEFNSKHDKLDVLVNNAGVMLDPEKHLKTEDGFEVHFGTNHLAHFLLTNLLLEKLKNASPSRIITLSALAHTHGSVENIYKIANPRTMHEPIVYTYNFVEKLFLSKIGPGNKPYCDSKLANAMFSVELSKRLEGTGVRTYALCPGVVYTNIADSLNIPPIAFKIGKYFMKFVLKTPEQGSWTTMYCALSKDLINESGQMYQNCHVWPPKDRTLIREQDARKLWELSERLVGIIPQ